MMGCMPLFPLAFHYVWRAIEAGALAVAHPKATGRDALSFRGHHPPFPQKKIALDGYSRTA